MSQTWVLLWLPLTAGPTPSEQQLLDDWARHQGATLRLSRATPARAPASYASEIVSHIERALEEARVALDAGDPKNAEQHAAAAEAELREHPELPQAHWLMAEARAAFAEAARALGNDDSAEAAQRDAQGLGGARAPELDESVEPALAVNAERTRLELSLRGWLEGDVVEWDGAAIQAPRERAHLESTSGLHHLRVLRGTRLLWAGWVNASEESPLLSVALATPAPCGAEDLALGRASDTLARVRCDEWVAARPGRPGSLELARCRRGSCEPFAPWPSAAPARALRTDEPAAETRSWAPWGYTFLGVAVAATATALIWSATRPEERDRTVWVYQGVR